MKFLQCVTLFGLAILVSAEPPSGYNYNAPQGQHSHHQSSGYSYPSPGLESLTSNSIPSFSSGDDSAPDFSLDESIMSQIRTIIKQEEIREETAGVSSSYGAPAPEYGAPSTSVHIVGIVMEKARPALSVAQFSSPQVGY